MQPNLQYLNAEIPGWLTVAFALTTALTLWGFTSAVRRAVPRFAITVLQSAIGWLSVLSILAVRGFFTELNGFPPRLVMAVAPTLLLIGSLFATPGGRRFVDALPLSTLTYLNAVRVPVELVIYGLYVQHQMPELMTFEGRNFDILAGLTAPVVAYFTFNRPVLPARALLVWNVVGLLLLINIVILAVLSAPGPVQRLAFDQPNVAILKFPLIWLPGFVVPVVLLGHLVAIRRLSKTTSRPF